MSAETIVKKRGRPKKIISETVEAELRAPEIKSTSSRAKSTIATPKAPKITKANGSVSAKTAVVKKVNHKPAESPKVVPIPIETSTTPLKASAASFKVEPQAPSAPTKIPVTSEKSKILQQVRDLSAKSTVQDPSASKISPPSNPPKASKPSQSNPIPAQTPKIVPRTTAAKLSPSQQPKATPSSTMSKPSLHPSKATPPPISTPNPTPRIPLAALNSAVVSNISERAGARPNSTRSKALPQGYNSVARKITFAIVAAPIAIVTSYVLYQRLVLGQERKLLVPAKVDAATMETFGVESTKSSET